MATNTPNLNLLKKDPATDGNETFNIKTMLNDNWDKIDAAVGNINIPDASTTVKGKVQLSSATDSDSETMAATPKAVKDASLQAKSYTDQQINLVTATGIPKLVSYPLKVTATVDNQTVFEIPLDLFDANTDTLMVAINRAALDPTQYTVMNTVRNQAGEVTQRAKITLLSGVTATTEVTMVVLKNVPIGKDGAINGAVLAADSVPINRVSGLQEKLDAQLADYVKHSGFAVSAGTSTAYTVALNPTPTSLVAGMTFRFKAHVDSGANPTINPDGLGAKAAKKANGNAASFKKDGIYTVTYDGTSAFILQGEGGGGTAIAGDLRLGKTATVDSGDITGTLDLTNLLPPYIKKGITVDGVLGTLADLAAGYIERTGSFTLSSTWNSQSIDANNGFLYQDINVGTGWDPTRTVLVNTSMGTSFNSGMRSFEWLNSTTVRVWTSMYSSALDAKYNLKMFMFIAGSYKSITYGMYQTTTNAGTPLTIPAVTKANTIIFWGLAFGSSASGQTWGAMRPKLISSTTLAFASQLSEGYYRKWSYAVVEFVNPVTNLIQYALNSSSDYPFEMG
ncbi:tail fiber protein [Paenibacillus puldeungensis]